MALSCIDIADWLNSFGRPWYSSGCGEVFRSVSSRGWRNAGDVTSRWSPSAVSCSWLGWPYVMLAELGMAQCRRCHFKVVVECC